MLQELWHLRGRWLAAVLEDVEWIQSVTLQLQELPQPMEGWHVWAAFAQAHFKVEKSERDGRTESTVQRLKAGDIERELAAMAVGEGADRAAIAEARRLVAKAKEREAGS